MIVKGQYYPAGIDCPQCGIKARALFGEKHDDERIMGLYRCGECGDILELKDREGRTEIRVVGGGASDKQLEEILERGI